MSVAILFVYASLVSIGCGEDSPAAKNPTAQKVEKARETYQSEAEKLKTSVTELMDKQIAAARKVGNKDALDILNKEIERFQSGGPMPSFLPESYHKKQVVMLQRVEKVLDAAVKDYTKKGMDSDAERIAAELKTVRKVLQTIDVRRAIVGTWKLRAGAYTTDLQFAADGTGFQTTSMTKGVCEFDYEAQVVKLVYTKNGFQETIHLPIDPRGTKGVNSQGNELVLVKK